jgi:8-oxo-dGTP pyrophosphatase MutT (NUDIX family)
LKLPLSVLVVVHTAEMEVLLLERAQRPGFWQSVTGSLDHPDEAFEHAAARELREETGIEAADGRLRRWNVAYTFEIYAQWRHRFAPGVTHNTEHLFSLELPTPASVTLAPREHTAFGWLPWREAARKCFSWSNRDAIVMVGAALLAAGCATGDAPLSAPLAPHLRSGASEVRECAAWYQALDREIDAAGVRNAQDARMAGFPHLRVNRFLAGLRARAAENDRTLRAYVERLAELDQEARRHEIQNLPILQNKAARSDALRRMRDCGRILRDADLASHDGRAALLAAAQVPDERSGVPATSEEAWQRRLLTAFQAGSDPSVQRVRYAPPSAQRLPRSVIAGLLGRANFDPLGHLALTAQEVDRLGATYAPTFEIETRADYDRFGWLRWRRGMALPQVDAAEPTVYVHAAYTRYGEHLLLQLVYTLWFPERPARDTFDPGAGPLNGVVWRVTLAPDGEPLVYDAIHACGCFHVFFPTARARQLPAPPGGTPQAFVPQRLPRAGEDERPVVTLASATHDIESVRLERAPESLVRYALRSYDELLSMPRLTGDHRSAFGADGRIAGSPARQWGRQPTAASGRHFDDADLLERRFALHL